MQLNKTRQSYFGNPHSKSYNSQSACGFSHSAFRNPQSEIESPHSAIQNPKSVLVVDDDPDDIEITRRVLAKSGSDLTVNEAPCGEAAIALLLESEELPALILMDVKMPGMNGIETLRCLRADERLRRIPVVVVTNSTLESDRTAALEAGAAAFLHKAFDMNEYEREIRLQLERWIKA